MSKLFTGSICLTDIVESAKKAHSSFVKSQTNGKVYCNVLLWENDEHDKFGNTHSLQLNSAKDKRDAEGKIYVGNFKPAEAKDPKPLSTTEAKGIGDMVDGLPF